MTSKASYLDPFVLARISNLQLRAKTVVEGFLSGLHPSPSKGYSLEFAQHREYALGDELKHLDWKVYARTDRFFIREFEQETNLRLYLLLDASGSMAYKGEKSPFSKYDAAATVAASLSYLTLRQGDSAGVSCFSNQVVRSVPPRNSLTHLSAILEEIESNQASGETTLSKAIETIAHSVRKRSLFILISDLFDDEESVLLALKFLKYKKNEVLVVHLLDRDEIEFPFTGNIRFDSLENDEKITLETDDYSTDYKNAMRAFLERVQLTLRNFGMGYHFHRTDQPIDTLLRSILSPQ